ncbi:cytochrome P450 [Coprinopsis marcescibilis]|uniref:Cytochrome P450 n=1 Tax=Coprinopsis marcescibilis TaxID=230819 RepID=A0A5C3L0Y5_COPMA|nr:cytochrome P450 [Coprinopsis marcescibilis]
MAGVLQKVQEIWPIDGYIVFIAAAIALYIPVYHRSEARKLQHIPAAGSGYAWMFYFDAVRYLVSGAKFLETGFSQAHSQIARVPSLFAGWVVVLRSREIIEEWRKGTDELFSLDNVHDSLQTEYTMSERIITNPYHIPIIRSQLQKALPQLIAPVYEEIDLSLKASIVDSPGEWTGIDPRELFVKAIAQASNRMLVGLPLCRNEEFLGVAINYTFDVVKMSTILRLFPKSVRPLVNRLLPTIENSVAKGMKYLGPMIKERKAQFEHQEGNVPDDFLQWMLEDATEEEDQDDRELGVRVLTLNFVSVHTTSTTICQATIDLAAYPQYQDELRAEAEAVVKEHGWTKEGLDKMIKIDSFIKESQRLHPVSTTLQDRLVTRDYTFKNGVTLPKGTNIALDIEHGNRQYTDPATFDPWRFYNIQRETDKPSSMTTLAPEFLSFGHGRHACPGRFFAAYEAKIALAWLLLKYDLKLKSGTRVPDILFGPTRLPNPKNKVLLRRRT